MAWKKYWLFNKMRSLIMMINGIDLIELHVIEKFIELNLNRIKKGSL
jgi:hypothetical protein